MPSPTISVTRSKIKKVNGQKKLNKMGHIGCIISENRFWFWADQEKKIDCIMDFTLLNMYSVKLDIQEYEELTSQLFLYKIIT